MTTAILVFSLLAFAAAVATPIIAFHAASARFRRDLNEFADGLNEQLEAPAKFLEVREFHREMDEQVRDLLIDARQRKDRNLLDRGQRMRERLDVLRARVLDKSLQLLEDESGEKRRRRRR